LPIVQLSLSPAHVVKGDTGIHVTNGKILVTHEIVTTVYYVSLW
jgi:hypothetical protein